MGIYFTAETKDAKRQRIILETIDKAMTKINGEIDGLEHVDKIIVYRRLIERLESRLTKSERRKPLTVFHKGAYRPKN